MTGLQVWEVDQRSFWKLQDSEPDTTFIQRSPAASACHSSALCVCTVAPGPVRKTGVWAPFNLLRAVLGSEPRGCGTPVAVALPGGLDPGALALRCACEIQRKD